MGQWGCASRQYGHILRGDDIDMVGSHAAGAATWNPLVDESVAKLLGRCPPAVQTVAFEAPEGIPINPAIGTALAGGPASVCFIGIENKSAEEMIGTSGDSALSQWKLYPDGI